MWEIENLVRIDFHFTSELSFMIEYRTKPNRLGFGEYFDIFSFCPKKGKLPPITGKGDEFLFYIT